MVFKQDLNLDTISLNFKHCCKQVSIRNDYHADNVACFVNSAGIIIYWNTMVVNVVYGDVYLGLTILPKFNCPPEDK